MKQQRRVYLSGGLEYAENEGRSWRSLLQVWLESTFGWTVFNPNIESDRFLRTHYPGIDLRSLKNTTPVLYTSIVAQLVDCDCREIADRVDFVLCYWDESAMRGAGTKGELTIARHFRKPVYMVTSIPTQTMPGWVLACTTRIFGSFEELKTFLLTSFGPPIAVDGEPEQA
jgi:hypothetical protein